MDHAEPTASRAPGGPRVNGIDFFVGFLVFLVPFAFLGPSIISDSNFDLPKRMLWMSFALCSLPMLVQARCRVRDGVFVCSFAICVYMVARTFFRPQPDAELAVLFVWLMPVFLLIAGYVMPQRRIAPILEILVCVGGVQVLLMILQRWGLDPIFRSTTLAMDYPPGRMIGTIGYHNQAVDFLALCCSGVFILTLRRAVWLSSIFIFVSIACLSGNRGGILAGAAAAVAALVVGNVNRRPQGRARTALLAGAVIATVFVLVVITPVTAARFGSLFTDFRASPGVDSRLRMAGIGIEMWLERPVVGWGAGEYAYQYLDRLAATLPIDKSHQDLLSTVFAREAHNDYVQFAAEFGMIGVILVLLLLGCIFHRLWQVRDTRPNRFAAAVFVLVYMGVKSLVAFPWQTSAGAPLAGLLIGLLIPRRDLNGGVTAQNEPWRHSRRFLGAVVMGLFIVGWLWWIADGVQRVIVANIEKSPNPAGVSAFLPAWGYRHHARVGAACAANGDHPSAERILRHASIGYRDIQLLNNLGHVCAAQNKWADAADVYELWAKTGLDHTNALRNLSVAYENQGRFSDAARAAGRLHELWPSGLAGDAERRAVLHVLADEPELALDCLESYLINRKDDQAQVSAQMHNLAGAAYLRLGQHSNAEIALRKALEMDPTLLSARKNMLLLETQNK